MKGKYIIISIVLIIFSISYLKNYMIYFPHKAQRAKYYYFYGRLKKLIESPDHMINKMIKTTDGEVLDTLYLKNLDSDICVIYFHGNAGNISMRFEMIKFLYTFASVLIFDYRSFGKSSGYNLLLSDRQLQTDADTMWSYATTELNYKPSKISLFGESLGCAVAIELASKLSHLDQLSYPHSLVLNAPFYSLGSMIETICGKMNISFLGNIFEKIWGNEFKSDYHIQLINHQTRVLISHSIDDEIIPFDQGKELYELIASIHPSCQFINIGGSHNNPNITSKYIYALSKLYQ